MTIKSMQNKNIYLLTLIDKIFLKKNILNKCRTLLEKHYIGEKKPTNCVWQVIFIANQKKIPEIQQKINKIIDKHLIDAVIHPPFNPYNSIKLAVFDMDSTLIQQEIMDELAFYTGKKDQVTMLTKKALEGKLDFNASLLQRLQLLAGIDETAMHKIYDNIQLTTGVQELLDHLHTQGCKTAILTGGFTWFAQKIQKKLGITHLVANQLEIKAGKLTGKLQGKIIDAIEKKHSLLNIAKKYAIPLKQTMAVGDGANDIPMLNTAGLGVAFHAKNIVKQQIPIAINHNSLNSLIYLAY